MVIYTPSLCVAASDCQRVATKVHATTVANDSDVGVHHLLLPASMWDGSETRLK